MCCPVCERDLKRLSEWERTEHVESHFTGLSQNPSKAHTTNSSDTVQCPHVECGVTMPSDSLSDHLLAHSVEESDHQNPLVDSEQSNDNFSSLKHRSDGMEWEGVITEGIIRAVRDYYGGIKGCRCWLSQETTHIHSTVEDLGWGCGYRNIQMMISCLLMHPLYSDHVMSIFCGIPTILELQKAIEKAWKEGYDHKGCAELNGRLVHTNKWIGTTEVAALLRYIGIRAEVVDFTKPSGSNSTHPKLFHWVKTYFENAEQSKLLPTTMNSRETTVQGSSHSNNVVSCSSKCDTAVDGDDAIVIDTDGPVAKKCKLDNNEKVTKSTNGIIPTDLPPLYLQHQGHSRTIIGLEQSQSDNDKMFLLLLDPLKDKRDMLKIKSSSCGNGVHRYMRRSVRQETHRQYELVFINGLLLDAKEREAAKYIKLYQRFE